MKIDTNDPKWTAYALGEITDENERAEIESILEQSSEARRLVEEIRRTAGLLREEFQTEPSINLTREQRSRIEAKATVRRNWFGLRPAWVMAGAAVVLFLVSFVIIRQVEEDITPRQKQQISVTPLKQKIESTQDTESPSALKVPSTSTTTVKTMEKMKPESTTPDVTVYPADTLPTESITQYASLGGIVTDSSGSVLPGATVEVIDDSNRTKEKTTTNHDGRYVFPRLSLGPHTVIADQKNFQKKTVTNLTLYAEQKARLNFSLPPRGAATKIEVTTSAEQLLLENAPVGKVIDKEQVTELPLVGRNKLDLVKAMSGVVGDDTFSNTKATSFAGVGANMVNLQQDGVTVNDVRYPQMMPPHWRRKGERPWPPLRKQDGEFNTESYDHISDNPFLDVVQNPLSTFSIDVDTASYSNVRRYLDNGTLPPKDAVRIEELVNYFDYDYKGPKDNKPFAVNFELTEAPWNPEHRLLRIGIKGREIKPDKRPNSNLVFLLDVSGSMDTENKLPLVKKSLNLLLDQLTESDRVAIVVYAGASGVVLPSTSGDHKEKIRYAIDRMHAGGSTNGASGIILAYQTAKENFFRGGVNRVILATDGDFNVGITNQGDLTRLIEEKAKSGIFLSALGFGMGNYKDSTLETLANKGRGNYAYIDNINEAKKVFVEQINSTLVTIAKDVKIQVEFNPGRVNAYRLIGYENRLMAKEDFNDDTKMAGVIGAGHAVTALYELVPAGVKAPKPDVDPLKYQKPVQPSSSAGSDEVVTVKIRSKEPEKETSVLSEFVVKESKNKFRDASRDFKFAAAVAAFGMSLRDSPYKGSANMEQALEWAKEGKGTDKHGYRQEFIRLIHRAISISF